ncbi:MAG: hypothetical protein WC506_06750 [Candidatus Micrarchaeia archaeon]
MGRNCERCRRDITVGGTHYNGHEYCMTCYQFVKAEDERRRAQAARKQEEDARKRREEALRKRDEDKLLKKASYVREAQEAQRRAEEARQKKELEARQKSAQAQRKSYSTQQAGQAGQPGLAAMPQAYSPLLGIRGKKQRAGAPEQAKGRREIAMGGLVAGLGKKQEKKKDENPLAEESKKRVSDYLALTIEQEKIAAGSALMRKKAKEYKAKLEQQFKEEKIAVSGKYEKLEAELSKRADSLGAAEFERQLEALEEQKAQELGKIEKWYSDKAGVEDKKLDEMRKASSAKISEIEKKKEKIESEINKRIAKNNIEASLPAIAEKELIEQIDKHASAAMKSLFPDVAAEGEGKESGAAKGQQKQGGEQESPAQGNVAADIIESEMARQAALEIGALLGKERAASTSKKGAKELYMELLEVEYSNKREEYAAPKAQEGEGFGQKQACPACHAPIGKSDKFCKKCGKQFAPAEGIHLEIDKLLPVSLSQGQREAVCVLIGTNAGPEPARCSLQALLQDSRKKGIGIQLSPSSASIAPGSKSGFEIRFDLPEDVPTGPLMLSATLSFNGGSSNPVSSVSNVKTPLALKYLVGSAKLGGKLDNFIVLAFDNAGESGGLLMLNSRVIFSDGSGGMKTGRLSAITKIKGLEKGVELSFGPVAMGQKFSSLSYALEGVDSNGKPYRSEGKI